MPHLSALFPDAGDVQWNVSHAQPYSGAEPSAAYIRACMAKCKSTVLHPAPGRSGKCC